MPSILVIDLDPMFLRIITRALEGFTVRATWNVDDALAILMRGVDLVISDFDLGDLTALDLISHSEQWRSVTPIVVMVSREGQRERALQAGAAAVLRKPLDLIEFRTAVDNLF